MRLNFGALSVSAKEVWRLLRCVGALPNTCFGKREEKWRVKGWGLSCGGQHDKEYTLRGMMWVDNYWLFSESREKLDLYGERHHRVAGGPGHGAQGRNRCGGHKHE